MVCQIGPTVYSFVWYFFFFISFRVCWCFVEVVWSSRQSSPLASGITYITATFPSSHSHPHPLFPSITNQFCRCCLSPWLEIDFLHSSQPSGQTQQTQSFPDPFLLTSTVLVQYRYRKTGNIIYIFILCLVGRYLLSYLFSLLPDSLVLCMGILLIPLSRVLRLTIELFCCLLHNPPARFARFLPEHTYATSITGAFCFVCPPSFTSYYNEC